MLFMIVERFKDQDMLPAYKKFREGGRMLPDGLKYEFWSMFSTHGMR